MSIVIERERERIGLKKLYVFATGFRRHTTHYDIAESSGEEIHFTI